MQVLLGALDGIRARWHHHGSEPKPEGQQVFDRDRTGRRHRVAELGIDAREDPNVAQLGQQLLDRVLQLHGSLVDEDHGGHRRHRFGERRDPEDVVAPQRFGVSERLRADDLHVHVVGVDHQCDEPGHRLAFHVRGQHIVQPSHAVLRQSPIRHAAQCAIAIADPSLPPGLTPAARAVTAGCSVCRAHCAPKGILRRRRSPRLEGDARTCSRSWGRRGRHCPDPALGRLWRAMEQPRRWSLGLTAPGGWR